MNTLRRSTALLHLAVTLIACRGEAGAPVGVSAPRRAEATRSGRDAGERNSVPFPWDFKASMTRVGEARPSRGHADRFDATLWLNELARPSWDGSGEAGDGAIFVEELSEAGVRGVNDAGLLVMRKESGAWRFFALDPQGSIADGPRTAACVVCHREAPLDFVFALTSTAQSVSATANRAMIATAPTSVASDAATYDARSAGSAGLPSSR